MVPTTVGIIGAGIAGPVLAMFLKQKGYNPVVYERSKDASTGGLSLCLQPNGLKVLQLIPGLIETLPGEHIKFSGLFSCVTNQTLVMHDLPSKIGELFGSGPVYGMFGVQREAFHKALIDGAIARGIPIHFGYHLERVNEKEAADGEQPTVQMHFANGETAEASFVIGCDGLHSNTRSGLFGEMAPSYTGLVQTGGMSPRPEYLEGKNVNCNFLGPGAHMVAYPITPTHYSWAVSQHEEERKESWRSIDEAAKEAFRNGPLSHWSCGAGDMVKNTTKVIKYGLYDRPELKTWHKGRIVLLGDAAHPTTPHLGQGANQAFEDIYHLIRVLQTHNVNPSEPPTTAQLTAAFAEYELVRIQRTSDLVTKARVRGALRTRNPEGEDAIHKREELWKESMSMEALLEETGYIMKGPFVGESEI